MRKVLFILAAIFMLCSCKRESLKFAGLGELGGTTTPDTTTRSIIFSEETPIYGPFLYRDIVKGAGIDFPLNDGMHTFYLYTYGYMDTFVYQSKTNVMIDNGGASAKGYLKYDNNQCLIMIY